MPDILNRSIFEEDLATRLAKMFGRQRREIIALLGDPPQLSKIPHEWWSDAAINLQRTVAPVLEDVYLQQAQVVMDTATIGIDWALVNESAVIWSNRYTAELLAKMTATTRRAVASAVEAFYTQGLSITDLKLRLMRTMSPTRAEMVAITEVTRAGAEGERLTALQIASETGVEMIPIWLTANDEKVCPICGPKHDQRITDGQFPPAHPRCRCWVAYELPPLEEI